MVKWSACFVVAVTIGAAAVTYSRAYEDTPTATDLQADGNSTVTREAYAAEIAKTRQERSHLRFIVYDHTFEGDRAWFRFTLKWIDSKTRSSRSIGQFWCAHCAAGRGCISDESVDVHPPKVRLARRWMADYGVATSARNEYDQTKSNGIVHKIRRT